MNDGWCKVWDYGWSTCKSCLDDVGLVSFPSFVGPLTAYDQDVCSLFWSPFSSLQFVLQGSLLREICSC
jgi:hypothetical protein